MGISVVLIITGLVTGVRAWRARGGPTAPAGHAPDSDPKSWPVNRSERREFVEARTWKTNLSLAMLLIVIGTAWTAQRVATRPTDRDRFIEAAVADPATGYDAADAECMWNMLEALDREGLTEANYWARLTEAIREGRLRPDAMDCLDGLPPGQGLDRVSPSDLQAFAKAALEADGLSVAEADCIIDELADNDQLILVLTSGETDDASLAALNDALIACESAQST